MVKPTEDDPDCREFLSSLLKQGFTPEQAQEILDILQGKVAYDGTVPNIVKEIVESSRRKTDA